MAVDVNMVVNMGLVDMEKTYDHVVGIRVCILSTRLDSTRIALCHGFCLRSSLLGPQSTVVERRGLVWEPQGFICTLHRRCGSIGVFKMIPPNLSLDCFLHIGARGLCRRFKYLRVLSTNWSLIWSNEGVAPVCIGEDKLWNLDKKQQS